MTRKPRSLLRRFWCRAIGVTLPLSATAEPIRLQAG